jgi:hypothetical protein
MTVDTAEFAAITDQLTEHEQWMTAIGDLLTAIGERAGIPIDARKPGRHRKLRVIDGGRA